MSDRVPAAPLIASAAVIAAAIVIAVSSPADAAPARAETAPVGETGWIRVAHLSPDTATVDVRLTALSGGEARFTLQDAAYGAVSNYTDLAAGSYVLSMLPAGADETSTPVISAPVTIEAGAAITVAALGPNDDLETVVFDDDLTSPEAGEARIRVVQASTVVDTVDVATVSGAVIADDAPAGSATEYVGVPAGPWDLSLTSDDGGSDGVDAEASVDVAAGSVSTLFVLDNASRGLSIVPVLDSSAAGDAPVGGVETGGGALAAQASEGRDLVSLVLGWLGRLFA